MLVVVVVVLCVCVVDVSGNHLYAAAKNLYRMRRWSRYRVAL
jgi:hypothetical protein